MIRKKIIPILFCIVLTFTIVSVNHKEAEASALTMTLGATGAAAGMTVGGVIAVALGIVAVGYGCYLVVDNWEDMTSACGDFLSNATGSVKDWWDSICESAVPKDEDTVPLPEKLQTPGEVINFFDYYVPTSGGSGEDPNNGDKMELNPDVLGALYSFLLTYYGVEALDPDKVFSNQILSSMSIEQLAEHIDYQPAAEKLMEVYEDNAALNNLGILYVLFTPRKPIEMYEDNVPIYGVLDVPDLSDTIFVGVKDDGTAAIFAMGYTGNAVSNDNAGSSGNYNHYTYPYYYPSGFDILNEPFMSTLHCNDDAAYYCRYSESGILKDAWTATSGRQWVRASSNEIYKYINITSYPYREFNLGQIEKSHISDPSGKSYNVPYSAFYTHYDGGRGDNYQYYYYVWDNVQYNDGNLIMGDYNVNFVGGRDYFHFYTYDYEHWLDNKEYYAQCFKNLTRMKGAIETYVDTTFEKFIPGEAYTLPKSNYKVSLPTSGTLSVDVTEQLLEELAKINLMIDDNFDRIIQAISEANKQSIEAGSDPIVNRPIIETGTNPETPGNIEVDLAPTNELIDGLPDRIAESMQVSMAETFSPTGDFTSINNLRTSMGNFFNFNILYEYHEMIETFLEQRLMNDDPPVFKIYPKQSELVYFDSMPDEVTVISFDWMEREIFTWDISIREFVRALLTFFVVAVWLNRTIKKLPDVVSGV